MAASYRLSSATWNAERCLRFPQIPQQSREETKKMHRLPGIHSRQEITFSHELGLPKSILWGPACQGPFERGVVSSRLHPFPTKAWFTKGLAFSPFMYHGWNAELGEGPLNTRDCQKLAVPESTVSSLEFFFFYYGISVENNSSTTLWQVCPRISTQRQGWVVKCMPNIHTSIETQGAVQYLWVLLVAPRLLEGRVGASLHPWPFIYVALKPWKLGNESPLWLGSLVPEREPSWKRPFSSREGIRRPHPEPRSLCRREKWRHRSQLENNTFWGSSSWFNCFLTASLWGADSGVWTQGFQWPS